VITVTAIPAPGHDFINWAGDATGIQNPIVIVADRDVHISGVFTGDTEPPDVYPPPNITTEATGVLTAVDLGEASAEDQVDGPLAPRTCHPLDGDGFRRQPRRSRAGGASAGYDPTRRAGS
jgi:hypothetical protein